MIGIWLYAAFLFFLAEKQEQWLRPPAKSLVRIEGRVTEVEPIRQRSSLDSVVGYRFTVEPEVGEPQRCQVLRMSWRGGKAEVKRALESETVTVLVPRDDDGRRDVFQIDAGGETVVHYDSVVEGKYGWPLWVVGLLLVLTPLVALSRRENGRRLGAIPVLRGISEIAAGIGLVSVALLPLGVVEHGAETALDQVNLGHIGAVIALVAACVLVRGLEVTEPEPATSRESETPRYFLEDQPGAVSVRIMAPQATPDEGFGPLLFAAIWLAMGAIVFEAPTALYLLPPYLGIGLAIVAWGAFILFGHTQVTLDPSTCTVRRSLFGVGLSKALPRSGLTAMEIERRAKGGVLGLGIELAGGGKKAVIAAGLTDEDRRELLSALRRRLATEPTIGGRLE